MGTAQGVGHKGPELDLLASGLVWSWGPCRVPLGQRQAPTEMFSPSFGPLGRSVHCSSIRIAAREGVSLDAGVKQIEGSVNATGFYNVWVLGQSSREGGVEECGHTAPGCCRGEGTLDVVAELQAGNECLANMGL